MHSNWIGNQALAKTYYRKSENLYLRRLFSINNPKSSMSRSIAANPYLLFIVSSKLIFKINRFQMKKTTVFGS